jgi:hypothetical protein
MADIELNGSSVSLDDTEVQNLLKYAPNGGVNVKWFGATGDGVTDDSAAIQAAVDWNEVRLTATATAAAGTLTLTFGSGVIPASLVGSKEIHVRNVTTDAGISYDAMVESQSATTVTMTADVNVQVEIGDIIAFSFVNKGIIHFPEGDYLLGSPITFNHPGSHSIVFQGVGAGSHIKGNIAGALFERSMTSITSGIKIIRNLRFTNSNAAGTAIELRGVVGTTNVENCWINAYRGITCSHGNSWQITDCKLIWTNRTAGSYGILASNATTITNADIQAYDHGIRHNNVGLTVVGGRFEVNNIAICLGEDEDGISTQSTAVVIDGPSMEENYEAAISATALDRFVINAVSAGNGSANSLTRGLDLRGAANGVVNASSFVSPNGGYSAAAVDVNGNSGIFLRAVTGTGLNSISSWTLPTIPTRITVEGSNLVHTLERRQSLFVDDFLAGAIDSRWSSTAGIGTGNEAATVVANSANGHITLKSASDVVSHASDATILTFDQLNYRCDLNAPSIEARLKISAITDVALFVGFTDTISTTVELPIYKASGSDDIDSDATNACGVCFDTQGTTDQWFQGGVKADTDTAASHSGSAPVADTFVVISVEVGLTGTVRGYINGIAIGTAGVSNAVTDSTSLTPCIVIANRGAAQRTCTIDYIRVTGLR